MKKKFLIVDDAYPNRYLLEQVLSAYDCLFAVDGSQMWDVLTRVIPDLIIMDIGLPHEDGLRLAKKLSQDKRYKDIPILFLTAHSSKTDIITAMGAGGYDYLVRPVDETVLVDRIHKVLEKKQRELRDRAAGPVTAQQGGSS